MSAPRPFEETLLTAAEAVIAAGLREVDSSARVEARLQVLEAAAARLGGFSDGWYRAQPVAGGSPAVVSAGPVAVALVEQIQALPFHHATALAALARPDLSDGERRSRGVYYTDSRLAQYLAGGLSPATGTQARVLDPACGSGMLLVAAALSLAGGDRQRLSALVGSAIHGADLSPPALRGAALALASLTADRGAIGSLLGRLRLADSLIDGAVWADVAAGGFDVVIGNPPWEKLKRSRHEMLRASGSARHYGADYEEELSPRAWQEARQSLCGYVARLNGGYELQASGEPDLYQLFLELSLKLTRPGGCTLMLAPAGLIRSLGAKRLRDYLLRHCSELEFTVMENRARFFAIDSRFKFLALSAQRGAGGGQAAVRLTTATGGPHRVVRSGTVRISRSWLYEFRPDLSMPEVRSESEWRIFRDITRRGQRFGASDGPWRPAIMREVDMTRDRAQFQRGRRPDAAPLLEGRMVHQYRHGAKRYREGTGRRAAWAPVSPAHECQIVPQFWLPLDRLPTSVQERVAASRVGFCDITGQTNERTMLAARIPPGVVCGNKVPTVLFEGAPSRDVSDCWLAIANSFCFDWLLRRVVTTTVNYFLLLDLPMPWLDPLSQAGGTLAGLARTVGNCRHETGTAPRGSWDVWAHAEARAEIDWRVLDLYGHDARSLEVMLADFPLLDRSQPPLAGEDRSTITRDLLLLRAAEALGGAPASRVSVWRGRVDAARGIGAVPYVPTQWGGAGREVEL